MERKTAADFPPEVLKLFDGYVHGRMSRRDFLDRAGNYAVGGLTAAAMLESLRPNYAFAQQVREGRPAHHDRVRSRIRRRRARARCAATSRGRRAARSCRASS